MDGKYCSRTLPSANACTLRDVILNHVEGDRTKWDSVRFRARQVITYLALLHYKPALAAHYLATGTGLGVHPFLATAWLSAGGRNTSGLHNLYDRARRAA